jgi:hypothetical protein
MSTHEHLNGGSHTDGRASLISLHEPSQLPEALRAPIEGVSFADYLFVEAARLDALPVGSVLAWLGVRSKAFARAEERWNDRLSEELAREGGHFDEQYEELLTRALSVWARSVEPLDSDVEAWMIFQRHALAAEDPSEMARGLGLTIGDEMRLARSWRERLADPEIAVRAEAAMSGPLLPLSKVSLSPFVFPPTLEAS